MNLKKILWGLLVVFLIKPTDFAGEGYLLDEMKLCLAFHSDGSIQFTFLNNENQ